MNESIVQQLIEARRTHPTDVYDQVFCEVSDRIVKSGSVGKADIGALLFWKRLRSDTPWAAQLNQLADSVVRESTGQAVRAAGDTSMRTPDAASAARRALTPLPGFTTGDALASAVIAAAAPKRMAVYDRRAHAALRDVVGRDVTHRAGRYGRYMAEIDALLNAILPHEPDWTARDVDLALYWIGAKA